MILDIPLEEYVEGLREALGVALHAPARLGGGRDGG
jgi:hypothetical protein